MTTSPDTPDVPTVPSPTVPGDVTADVTGDVTGDVTPPSPAVPGSPPTVGLAEAARLAGVSKPTIRRRREALEAAGATVSDTGWVIPIPALVATGLLDRVTAADPVKAAPGTAATSPGSDTPPPGTPVPVTGPVTDRVTTPVTSPLSSPGTSPLVEHLKAEVAELRQRVAVAEAVAVERDRVIEAQAMTLRMLEVGPVGAAMVADRAAGEGSDRSAGEGRQEVSGFRRWWSRLG